MNINVSIVSLCFMGDMSICLHLDDTNRTTFQWNNHINRVQICGISKMIYTI